MWRELGRTITLFVLTTAALWLGMWPLMQLLFGVNLLDPASAGLWWLPAGLALLGALTGLLGTDIYLRHGLRARRLQRACSRQEQWLLGTTRRLAARAGIPAPRIAIHESLDFNAFAAGWSRRRATIVLSRGLLHSLREDELEAVLAHELAHVANGDMQALALLQGLLTVLVQLPARGLEKLLVRLWPTYRSGRAEAAMQACLLVCGAWLPSLLVMRFSRHCEYRADRAAARLVGLERMRAALRNLNVMITPGQTPQLAAFGLAGRLKNGFARQFDSHPSLPLRLAALRQLG